MNRRTKLDDVFDVETREVANVSNTLPDTTSPNINSVDSVDSDAEIASANLKKLIVLGQDAAERAAAVAEESESPRAYEVLSTLLKTMSDMNIQMLDIHEKKKKIKTSVDQPPAQGGTVNNTSVFVGTTAGLMELLEQHRKGNRNAS